MIPDGKGGAFIAWTDYRRGERNPDIYAQRLDGNGHPLWQKGGSLVCGAPDVQRFPALADDKEGGIFIAWTDKGGGSYDIYAQHLNREGQPLWLTDGIPVNQSARTQQNPFLISFGDQLVIVWEDYRYGNWDLFAAALSPAGKLLWGEEGVAVAEAPLTQYDPQITGWKNKSIILGWEDYRSGKQYEIYIQKIDSSGKPAWPEGGLLVKSSDGARAPKLLPLTKENAFIVTWEDYTGGQRAIFGQKFITD